MRPPIMDRSSSFLCVWVALRVTHAVCGVALGRFLLLGIEIRFLLFAIFCYGIVKMNRKEPYLNQSLIDSDPQLIPDSQLM